MYKIINRRTSMEQSSWMIESQLKLLQSQVDNETPRLFHIINTMYYEKKSSYQTFVEKMESLKTYYNKVQSAKNNGEKYVEIENQIILEIRGAVKALVNLSHMSDDTLKNDINKTVIQSLKTYEEYFLKSCILQIEDALTKNKKAQIIEIFSVLNKFYEESPNKIVDFLIPLALYNRKCYNALKKEISQDNSFHSNFFQNVECAINIYSLRHDFSKINETLDDYKEIKREVQKKIVTGKSKYFDNLDLKNFNIHKYNFLYRGDDFKTPHISIIKKDLLGKTSDPHKRLAIFKSSTLVNVLFYSLNSAGKGAVFNRLDEILKGECIDKRISNTAYEEFQRNVHNLLNTNSEEYKALKLAIENSIDQSSKDKETVLQEKINEFIKHAIEYNQYIKQYRKDKSKIDETIKSNVKDMRNYYKKSSIFHKNTLCQSLKEEVSNLKK